MNEVAQIIAAELGPSGVISFERFMALALYCPVYGYYEKEADSPGRQGDYYTSVSVGSLFGELLAWQFAEWLQQAGSGEAHEGSPNPAPTGIAPAEAQDAALSPAALSDGLEPAFHLVEAGAHNGQLAHDVLAWLRNRHPTLFGRLQYFIVEPSGRRAEWQRAKLSEFGPRVRWVQQLADLARPGGGVTGVIFSNELLDAMPVRRWGWDARAKQWFEWGVRLDGERFAWARLPTEPSQVCGQEASLETSPLAINPQLSDALPDGFIIETSLSAAAWWREAANALKSGRLLTIDYGLTDEERFRPERSSGTLRAYRGHQVCRDVLALPGEQDITAHVDFSAIRRAGESAGLRTEGWHTQEKFLTMIAARAWQDAPGASLTSRKTARQFRTLTNPEHLGRAFRVLVQSKARLGAA